MSVVWYDNIPLDVRDIDANEANHRKKNIFSTPINYCQNIKIVRIEFE